MCPEGSRKKYVEGGVAGDAGCDAGCGVALYKTDATPGVTPGVASLATPGVTPLSKKTKLKMYLPLVVVNYSA